MSDDTFPEAAAVRKGDNYVHRGASAQRIGPASFENRDLYK